MQFAGKAPLGLADRLFGVLRIRQIDLDVVLGSGLPRAIFRKRMPRAGDDAPARGGKALDRGMADASACSGEKERTSRLVYGRSCQNSISCGATR